MDDSDRLSALRAALIDRLGRQKYEVWVGPQTTLEFHCDGLRVGCPTTFELQWLRRRIHTHLVECCRLLGTDPAGIDYFVRAQATEVSPLRPLHLQRDLFDVGREQASPKIIAAQHASTTHPNSPSATPETTTAAGASKKRVRAKSVQSLSTFETFVSGPCNELATRTAKTVAARPGHFGLLMLYGPAGVGKTHLGFSILQQVRQSAPHLKAIRLTSEQFTTEFLEALNRRSLPGFRNKYRGVDVLLIDDIQFLVGKRATLEELMTTIDALHESGKQVILTCNCSPGELQKVNTALVTRISGGLAIPIDLPNFETRLSLVQRFIAQMQPRIGLTLDGEIAKLIATHISGSARQLRGALNRLIVTSEALAKPLTLDFARMVITESLQQITPTVRLIDIQHAVCEVFGIEVGNLKSKSKTRNVAEPRMLAMWLACELTRSALGEISEFFGRSSHSTVISAQKRIEQMVSQGSSVTLADRECPVEEAIRKIRAHLRTA